MKLSFLQETRNRVLMPVRRFPAHQDGLWGGEGGRGGKKGAGKPVKLIGRSRVGCAVEGRGDDGQGVADGEISIRRNNMRHAVSGEPTAR